MTKDEAMRMALDALITAELDGNCEYGATNALRTALAQPEPEPVAWITVVETKQGHSRQVNWTKMRGISHAPLYTAPPQRKPLSKEQCLNLKVTPMMTIEQVVRIVEAAHGIKD